MGKTLRLIVSLGLLGWLAWRTDWPRVSEMFARLRVDLWLAAVMLYCLAQFASGLRWRVLSRPLGFRQSSWRLTGFYFIGMFFNLLLPTSMGGDVVRAWYLDGGSGRKRAALLSVLMDRLSGLVVLLALSCLAVLFSPIALPLWVAGCAWAALACFVLGLATAPRLARLPIFRERYAALCSEVLQSLSGVFRPATLLLSLLVQSLNIAIVWLVGQATGAEIPGSYYWIFVPMVTLATLLPVGINGMGIREGATVLFLHPLGVPEATALGLAFLWFSVSTTASLVGGVVYLVGRFPRLEVRSDHESIDHHSHQGRAGQHKAAA